MSNARGKVVNWQCSNAKGWFKKKKKTSKRLSTWLHDRCEYRATRPVYSAAVMQSKVMCIIFSDPGLERKATGKFYRCFKRASCLEMKESSWLRVGELWYLLKYGFLKWYYVSLRNRHLYLPVSEQRAVLNVLCWISVIDFMKTTLHLFSKSSNFICFILSVGKHTKPSFTLVLYTNTAKSSPVPIEVELLFIPDARHLGYS